MGCFFLRHISVLTLTLCWLPQKPHSFHWSWLGSLRPALPASRQAEVRSKENSNSQEKPQPGLRCDVSPPLSLFFFFQPFDKQSKAQKKFTVSFCLFRFEFSVSLVELHRRNLDVAVKNGGGLLSKHKGLLGKVQTSLIYCLYLCVTEKHLFNTMKPSEWKFCWFWEKPHFVRLCLKVQVLLFFLLLVSYFYEVHHFDCIRKRCGFVFVCF